jgi:hypothetical protein
MASLLILAAPLARSQVTLTGAAWIATTSDGSSSVEMAYADGFDNTVGGDQWYDLWLALDQNGSSPVNGPSDAQAGISISLLPSQRYKYYVFGTGPCCTSSYSGLNLFFNGDSANPGISVFGQVGSPGFRPTKRATLSLDGVPVQGSGTPFFTSAGITVLLKKFDWFASDTTNRDLCQAFSFTPAPGNVASSYGSFVLDVFPEASVRLAQDGRTIAGSRFDPDEDVAIYAGSPGDSPVIANVVADGTGAFTLEAPRVALGAWPSIRARRWKRKTRRAGILAKTQRHLGCTTRSVDPRNRVMIIACTECSWWRRAWLAQR